MAREDLGAANENLLNIITPSGLEFYRDYYLCGERYCRIMAVTKYPSTPDIGWIEDISQMEGVTAKFEITPTEPADLIDRSNEQIRDYRAELGATKEESDRQNKEQAVQDLQEMIRRIREGELVVYLNLMLLVQADTKERLAELCKKVQGRVASFGGSVRTLTFLQKQAYQAMAPYGAPDSLVEKFGSRNMPLSTLMGGFFNSASGLNDGRGYILGRSENGKMVILNTRMRGDDRTNCNWFISGVPGVGKSTVVKTILAKEFALGAHLLILDPDGEYRDLTRNLGGRIIRNSRINPLQIRRVPVRQEEDGGDEGEELFKDAGKGMNDLAFHLQSMRSFFKAYKPELTTYQLDIMEEILEGTYGRFQIGWDVEIDQLGNGDYPVMADFYQDVKAYIKAHPEDKEIKKLQTHLRAIAEGADAWIFNGHTDLAVDTDVVDLDISVLKEMPANIQNAAYSLYNSFAWNELVKHPDELLLYVVDEGYLQFDPKTPEQARFLKVFSKRDRKYEGGLIFVTHAISDILDPEVKREGQALLDNSCYKLFMGTDGKNAKETTELYELTAAERDLLESMQRGKGLLFVGSKRLSITVTVPEELMALFGSAGGR